MAGTELLLDISSLDMNHVVADIEEIRRYNSQRFEMEQLTAVVFADPATLLIAGYKDIRPDEFWARGHMPGMPIMPGVIMCEVAAQLCSFFAMKYDLLGCTVVGFGGIDEVRFREPVLPGDRLVMVAKQIKIRRGALIVSQFQGFVGKAMVVEGLIKGVPLPVDRTPEGLKIRENFRRG